MSPADMDMVCRHWIELRRRSALGRRLPINGAVDELTEDWIAYHAVGDRYLDRYRAPIRGIVARILDLVDSVEHA